MHAVSEAIVCVVSLYACFIYLMFHCMLCFISPHLLVSSGLVFCSWCGLIKAMIAVGHKRKRDPRKMLGYIASCPDVNESEVCGIMRWAVTLKTTCKKKQLPAAFKVLDWAVRLGPGQMLLYARGFLEEHPGACQEDPRCAQQHL